jgi:hypothetical protein
MPIDPRKILDSLGAQWSPDFDAYASGKLDITQVRCLLCGKAPCECKQCTATVHHIYYLATGGPEYEICGMTIQANGECYRGHRADSPNDPTE